MWKVSLNVMICGLVLGCATTKKSASKYPQHPLSIVQGATSDTETYISVVARAQGVKRALRFVVESTEKSEKPKKVLSFFKKRSPDGEILIEHLHLKNLRPGQHYKLKVLDKDHILDERSFKTLNLDQKLRFGVVSCTDDNFSSDEMWTSYLNKFSDVNFFIGDNVYTDWRKGISFKPNVDDMWQRYAETLESLYFYHSASLSPTYFVWDDHDYGKNDGGKSFKHKKESLEIFNSFFPRGEIKGLYKKTRAAGSVLDLFQNKFIFVDNRFFRDKSTKGSHWGKEQSDVIFSEISKSEGLTWLIQGDQFFGGYHPFESFEKNHPQDFKKTLKELKKTGKKVVFVSGDRHMTEIMEIEKPILGYKTVEITSSGMHAKVFPDSLDKHPNPRQVYGKSGVYNYTIIDLPKVQKRSKPSFKVYSYGTKDWLHYSKEVAF